MAVKVLIPTQLRTLTSGEREVDAEGGTVAEVIDGLERRFPGLGHRLLDESGEIRRFVNIYLNSEDVRFLGGLRSDVPAEAAISIIPAVAGGAL